MVRMEGGSVEGRVEEIATRVTRDRNLELVHVEFAQNTRPNPVIRIFIDKPEGVTHEDCSEVSLHLGTILDVEDFIPSAYTLEVSSPGLERGLYKRSDYERFAGHKAKLKTREAINNQRNFRGRILNLEGDDLLFEDKTNGTVRIPLNIIVKANLEIDIEEEFRRAEELNRTKKHQGSN
jgi:ribosome maturation factor RimP